MDASAAAESVAMERERRDFKRRAAVVDCIVRRIIQVPGVTVSIDMLREWCHIPVEAARRILLRLAGCGLMREMGRGVFLRNAWSRRESLS